MEALGINLGYLLVQIIAFIVLYTFLTRWIYDPLNRALSERRARIAKGLEDSAAAAKARQNAEAEAAQILAQARAEGQRAIEEARSRGEEVARQIETEARAEADRIRADARQAANQERDSELAALRGQVASISIAVAQRLLGEELDAKKQQSLIDDFFTRVPDGAKSLGGSVEVISAMPLAAKEQTKVKKELGADEVTFTVDPSILGGLIVRGEDRVLDGSVRSGLSELSALLA